MVKVNEKIAYAYSRIDTGTLRDLSAASCKLFHEHSHGKVYAYIDSGSAFLQTAIFSVMRLVKHVAFTVLSLFTIWSRSGRNFLLENITRCFIDLTGIILGLIGTPLPYVGLYATAQVIKILNTRLLDHDIVSKDLDRKNEFGSPIWVTRYLYQSMQRSNELAFLSYGGADKLQKKRKA